MLSNPAQLVAPTALSATTTTALYTVPASTKALVKEILLCNTDTVARTVTVFFGSGTAAANTVLSAYSLNAGQTVSIPFNSILIAADKISGGASSAAVVSIMVSGMTAA